MPSIPDLASKLEALSRLLGYRRSNHAALLRQLKRPDGGEWPRNTFANILGAHGRSRADVVPEDLLVSIVGLACRCSQSGAAMDVIKTAFSTGSARAFETSIAAGEEWRADGGLYDFDRLPRSADLPVGRDEYLAVLEQAWQQPDRHVVMLTAEGGAGKSTIVQRWLGDPKAAHRRQAEFALAWSFERQGKDDVGAENAGRLLDWLVARFGVIGDSEDIRLGKLATEMARRRGILILDGLEALQHPPDHHHHPNTIRDERLARLVKRLVDRCAGLVVFTTRVAVAEIIGSSAVQEEPVAPFSDRDARELLTRALPGVPAEVLAKAEVNLGKHALSLSLFVGYVRSRRLPDARAIERFLDELGRDAKVEDVLGRYRSWWLSSDDKSDRAAYQALRSLSLFDRPVEAFVLDELRMALIPEISDEIASRSAWDAALGRLEAARLLAKAATERSPRQVHPMVRAWAERDAESAAPSMVLRAHGVIYGTLLRHGRREARERKDFSLLYQAVRHGVRAGRAAKVNDRVVGPLINGSNRYSGIYERGEIRQNLELRGDFFIRRYVDLVPGMPPFMQAWILNNTGTLLTALGRIKEADDVIRLALKATLSLKPVSIAKPPISWSVPDSDLDNRPHRSTAYRNVAESALMLGDPNSARELGGRALSLASASNVQSKVCDALALLACIDRARNRPEDAQAHALAAVRIAMQAPAPEDARWAYKVLALPCFPDVLAVDDLARLCGIPAVDEVIALKDRAIAPLQVLATACESRALLQHRPVASFLEREGFLITDDQTGLDEALRGARSTLLRSGWLGANPLFALAEARILRSRSCLQAAEAAAKAASIDAEHNKQVEVQRLIGQSFPGGNA